MLWAAAAARRARKARTVARMEIEVVDSTSQGHLVSAAMVRGWISDSGIPTIGTAVDEVDLSGIETLIARNGFVDEAVAYVDYGAVLHIGISQRKPLLRLLTDGMNAYVTSEGYVFAAPRASSLYVPVVPGLLYGRREAAYRRAAAGDRTAHRTTGAGEISLLPPRDRERPRHRRAPPDADQAALVAAGELRGVRRPRQGAAGEEGAAAARLPLPEPGDPRADRGDRRAAGGRAAGAKKIGKKLRRFHETPYLCENRRGRRFLEVGSGADRGSDDPQRRIGGGAPRSGRFTILFGRLDDIGGKVDKLLRFYRSGLSSIGWDEYRTIDVRYRNQVVCKK